jgi:hypothetical protein
MTHHARSSLFAAARRRMLPRWIDAKDLFQPWRLVSQGSRACFGTSHTVDDYRLADLKPDPLFGNIKGPCR